MRKWTPTLGGICGLLLVGGAAWAGAEVSNRSPSPDRSSSHESVGEQTSPGPAPSVLSSDSPMDDVMPLVSERIGELGASGGFVGQRTDYENRIITVIWSGRAPNDLYAYAESQPYGVEILIKETGRYSRADAEAARERLITDPAAQELGIVAVSVSPDGDGLMIGTTRPDTFNRAERERLDSVAGIDFEIQYGVAESTGYDS